jgi:transcription termination/antitermination protein NusA
MQKIRYDNALLKIMSFFESGTGTKLRDCFEDQAGAMVFVVEPAQMGLAIGRGGVNAKRLEASLKKKIRIIEYSDDLASFVKGILHPYKAQEIKVDGDVVTISADSHDRGFIIGRGGQNLRNYEFIAKRFFPIKELKVA